MNPNYNPLSFLFYPFILAVLFTSIYFVWQRNPSLMDQLSLIEKQSKKERRDSFLVQTNPISMENPKRFDPTSFAKLEAGQAKHYPADLRINHRFRAYDAFESPIVNLEEEHWIADGLGMLKQSKSELQSLDIAGNLNWKFQLEAREFCPGAPSLSSDFIYLCTTDGDVLALFRETGRVAWLFRSQFTLWRSPLLTNKELLVFEKSGDDFSLINLKRESGEQIQRIDEMLEPLDGEFALSKTGKTLVFATEDSRVFAYSLESRKKLWEVALTEAAGAPPVVYEDEVFVSGSDGLLLSLDIRSGKINWEYSVKKSLDESVTVMPGINIGTIVDDTGYLHVMDLKEGKRKWRYNMKSNSKQQALHAIRFSKDSARRLNMSGESQGWSFWGACGSNQVCAFEPFKGYMLRKYELPGPMAAAPLLLDKGQELLLSYLEGKTLKFLKFIEKTKLDLMEKAEEPVQEPLMPSSVDNGEPEN